MAKGYKSTEFWLSLAAMILGALMASGIIEAGTTADKLVGLGASLLGALGYTVSRTMVKTTEAKAAAVIQGPKS
jgi:hypothetical protein